MRAFLIRQADEKRRKPGFVEGLCIELEQRVHGWFGRTGAARTTGGEAEVCGLDISIPVSPERHPDDHASDQMLARQNHARHAVRIKAEEVSVKPIWPLAATMNAPARIVSNDTTYVIPDAALQRVRRPVIVNLRGGAHATQFRYHLTQVG